MIKKYNYKNILTEEDQDLYIKIIDKIYEGGDYDKNNPGIQTPPYLFDYPEFFKLRQTFFLSCSSYLNRDVTLNLHNTEVKCWCHMNYRYKQQRDDIENYWHDHNPTEISGIYYLKTPKTGLTQFKTGTEFLDKSIGYISPENFSWFIFPSHLIHRPGLIKSNQKRYVIAATLTTEYFLLRSFGLG